MATIREQKKITQFYDFPPNVQFIKVTLTSAEVLALNSTPIEVLPAEEGYFYQTILPSAGPEEYGTAPYATNVELIITTDTATTPQAISDEAIASSVSRVVTMQPGS